MDKKIFLLNGPPFSGKDTLGEYVTQLNDMMVLEKFSAPLKKACRELFCLTNAEYSFFEVPHNKGTICDRLQGTSWRQAQIDMSEVFVKKNYSDEFFGNSLVERVKQSTKKFFVVSDSGFACEARPVIRQFGNDNVFLIRLQREGMTYQAEKDSRSYLDGDELGIKQVIVTNEDLDKFLKAGVEAIYSFI